MKTLVVGVGSAGINYINRTGADFFREDTVGVSCNARELESCRAGKTLQIGGLFTKEPGTVEDPETVRKAAEESADDLAGILEKYECAIIVCGLGGATGTGASPVIAGIARDMDLIVAGAVILPFQSESAGRRERAAAGLERMKEESDVILCIANDSLLKKAAKDSSLTEVMMMSDHIFAKFIKDILNQDRICENATICFDRNDLDSRLHGKGMIYCGFGSGEGPEKAAEAVAEASENALLDDNTVRIKDASGVIFNLTGDICLDDAFTVVRILQDMAGRELEICFGVIYDPSFQADCCELTVVATR